MIIGDFIAVMGSYEKTGLLALRIWCDDFRYEVEAVNLDSIYPIGTFCTWAGRGAKSYVESWLDHSFCSQNCISV